MALDRHRRFLGLWLAAASVCLLGTSTAWADGEEVAPPPAPSDTDVDDLPVELPPLDDDLLNALQAQPQLAPKPSFWDQVVLDAAGGVRLDAGAAHDAYGALASEWSGFGEVGLQLPLGEHEVHVRLGEGGAFGRRFAHLPHRLDAPPAFSPLWASHLRFQLPLFGQRTDVDVGRMRHQVGDGRYWGVMPYTPRGSTVDGLRVRSRLLNSSPVGTADVVVGGFIMAPAFWPEPDVNILGSAELAWTWTSALQASLYAFAERPSDVLRTTSTSGARVRWAPSLASLWSPLAAAVDGGVDAQVHIDDGASWNRNRGSVHGEASVAASFDGGVDVGVVSLRLHSEVTTGNTAGGDMLQAPAPNVHGVLGVLDAVAPDNIMALAPSVQWQGKGMVVDATVWAMGMVDGRVGAFAPDGRVLVRPGPSAGPAPLLVEIDGRIQLAIDDGLHLVFEGGALFPAPSYSSRFTSAAPRLRALASIVWQLQAGDGALPVPRLMGRRPQLPTP